jgi:2-phosphosulfolactate phosphatase
MPELYVHLLPELAAPDDLRGATCVVIDVLRATTTIAYALAAGVETVIPCLEVEEARSVAVRLPAPLLGGERGGVRIEGFDLANSPAECTSQRVAGRYLVFTTTNGTKAMQRAKCAKRVLLAAFVNLSAVVDALRGEQTIHVLCAGTQNQITREDVLLAGAIVGGLSGIASWELNDSARIAQAAWRELASHADRQRRLSEVLATKLRDTQGGRNLIRLGLEADLRDCADVDRFGFVPELDLVNWRIDRVQQSGRDPSLRSMSRIDVDER